MPRFYLERFADSTGHVWTFDKSTHKVFAANATKLARQSGFYEAPALGSEVDQTAMESRLADLEAQASQVTARWLHIMGQNQAPNAKVVEDNDRSIMAFYVATQAFRTPEQRILLSHGAAEALKDVDLQTFHVSMLADSFIDETAKAISEFVWILARNDSGFPFYTSDHPVVLRRHDHQCLHVFQFPEPGSEVLLPLSSTVMFYAYERTHWSKLAGWDGGISPVRFTQALVESNNSAQVGHSRRFVFCDRDAFGFARSFCEQHPAVRDATRNRFER